ncbi:hypothetical protein P7K49_006193 [Saguinus oedipus]|uniref:Uncharacterized protein n=1 Tax=Saguinus oedipus TaxID=9490 RepID=A0ABQ9W5B6_SAGOE|nr:hypothetical protein P7K49_006193 [Saguinus oedipus]
MLYHSWFHHTDSSWTILPLDNLLEVAKTSTERVTSSIQPTCFFPQEERIPVSVVLPESKGDSLPKAQLRYSPASFVPLESYAYSQSNYYGFAVDFAD